MLRCEGYFYDFRYDTEIPNGENAQSWVANLVLKFHENSTMNKFEIVVFLRQIWWSTGKREG